MLEREEVLRLMDEEEEEEAEEPAQEGARTDIPSARTFALHVPCHHRKVPSPP